MLNQAPLAQALQPLPHPKSSSSNSSQQKGDAAAALPLPCTPLRGHQVAGALGGSGQ